MKQFYEDFKKFISRGNVIDLAVAVVVGTAFNAVVFSFTIDIILPFIAAVGQEPSFNDLTFTIGEGVIRYGTFITALLNFLIIAFTVFLVVKAFEKLQAFRSSKSESEQDALTDEARILIEIRDLLAQQQRQG